MKYIILKQFLSYKEGSEYTVKELGGIHNAKAYIRLQLIKKTDKKKEEEKEDN
jgi:hypothetical protein